jgi:hypothetical protein
MVSTQTEKSKNSYLPLYAALGVALVGGIVFLLSTYLAQKPFEPLTLEIVSAEGDSQIVDPVSHSRHSPLRGEELREGQKLVTGRNGVINFRVENKILLRLRGNSELVNKKCRVQEGKDIYELFLAKGVLMGATTKEFDRIVADGEAVFSVRTHRSTATPNGALFRVEAGEGDRTDKVGVLRGAVEMTPFSYFSKKPGVRIRGLEKASLIGDEVQEPSRVSVEEWQEMKEVYELLVKSAAMEAEQIDLAKLAGGFFKNVVFDHGTFFTPDSGYAGRDFFKDPKTGEVFLETEYDVFPPQSFVGVYMKTRDFDFSRYEGLTFEVRRRVDEGAPEMFLIEFKSKGNVLRKFVARGFHQEWTPMDFEFHEQRPSPVSEMVFVFLNQRAGEEKKGVLEFRRFNLVPKKQLPPVPKPVAKPVAPPAGKVAPAVSQPAPRPVPQSALPPAPVVQTSPEILFMTQAAEPAKPKKTTARAREADDELVPQVISLK